MELLPFMGHDFSFRGMFGRQAAGVSGFGHLTSGFAGTDTIPAVLFAEKYYNANVDKELVGCSVDATEHSVTGSWIEEGEKEFFRELMTKHSPTGILSVVSDTWNFWKLVTEYLPEMKEEIMARDGKLVIRPDSGDPVDILCGLRSATSEEFKNGKVCDAIFWNNKYYSIKKVCALGLHNAFISSILKNTTNNELFFKDCVVEEGEVKGLVECLWDTFGGTLTDKGYKLLDSHIGAIYGDSITLNRQVEICERLIAKGFTPTVVLGIGSYTYQYVTRDTHGSAVKATNVIKGGKDLAIFKDPITDPGKKSHKGLLRVEKEEGKYVVYDNQDRGQESTGELKPVFRDGVLLRVTSLEEIRQTVRQYL